MARYYLFFLFLQFTVLLSKTLVIQNLEIDSKINNERIKIIEKDATREHARCPFPKAGTPTHKVKNMEHLYA